MRLINFKIVTISLIVTAMACTNTQKPKDASFDNKFASSMALDTLVNSFPLNYLSSIDASQKLEISSYKELLELFEKQNYTPEAWQAGIREIPRFYIVDLGDKWGDVTSKEVTVLNKKRLFFRGIMPLILHSNELILADRDRLERILSSFQKNTVLKEMDQIWIQKLAGLYEVENDEKAISESMLEELLERVDIVPVSLALAQAAVESGWGTSRFADVGNAIYGQWSWGENAIIPEEQRKGLGNYGIAAFESLQESVCAYMLNINTHNAYVDLRKTRADLRKNGKKITGYILADELTRYSEMGMEYVNSLKSMMDYNNLNPADEAYFSDNPAIYLSPAEN